MREVRRARVLRSLDPVSPTRRVPSSQAQGETQAPGAIETQASARFKAPTSRLAEIRGAPQATAQAAALGHGGEVPPEGATSPFMREEKPALPRPLVRLSLPLVPLSLPFAPLSRPEEAAPPASLPAGERLHVVQSLRTGRREEVLARAAAPALAGVGTYPPGWGEAHAGRGGAPTGWGETHAGRGETLAWSPAPRAEPHGFGGDRRSPGLGLAGAPPEALQQAAFQQAALSFQPDDTSWKPYWLQPVTGPPPGAPQLTLVPPAPPPAPSVGAVAGPEATAPAPEPGLIASLETLREQLAQILKDDALRHGFRLKEG